MSKLLLLSTLSHTGWIVGLSLLTHHNINNFYGWFISVSGFVASVAGAFNVDLSVRNHPTGMHPQYLVWLMFCALYSLYSMEFVATNSVYASECVSYFNEFDSIVCDAWYLTIASSASSMFCWLLGVAAMSNKVYNSVVKKPSVTTVIAAENQA